jgi:hypothetical protein
MLRRNPRYKLQVPHGLAILGALLLLAGTVTGLGSALQTNPAQTGLAASAEMANPEPDSANRAAGAVDSIPQAQIKKNKRFKVNLFLFRR